MRCLQWSAVSCSFQAYRLLHFQSVVPSHSWPFRSFHFAVYAILHAHFASGFRKLPFRSFAFRRLPIPVTRRTMVLLETTTMFMLDSHHHSPYHSIALKPTAAKTLCDKFTSKLIHIDAHITGSTFHVSSSFGTVSSKAHVTRAGY